MNRQPSELKIIRLQLGWTTSQMASRLGCKTQQVFAFEAGSEQPSPEFYDRYEQLFMILNDCNRKPVCSPLPKSRLAKRI